MSSESSISQSSHVVVEGFVSPGSSFSFAIDSRSAGKRIDIFLATRFSSYSRSFFQRMIDSARVFVNNILVRKQGVELKTGDVVRVAFPEEAIRQNHSEILQKSHPIACIHEDTHFLVINKPANLVTHKPREQYSEPTIIDWLTLHFAEIGHVGYIDRPGIVHRLDKDTSGLMLIARSNQGHRMLTELFKTREIHKTYLALVEGHPPQQGSIDYAIGRHPTYRTKMAVRSSFNPALMRPDITTRDALTTYTVLHYFQDTALVQATPFTGRTHQIRVHLAALGHPLLGDLLYGAKSQHIERQALHAYKLAFNWQGQLQDFTLNPPEDFRNALKALHVGHSPLPEALRRFL